MKIEKLPKSPCGISYHFHPTPLFRVTKEGEDDLSTKATADEDPRDPEIQEAESGNIFGPLPSDTQPALKVIITICIILLFCFCSCADILVRSWFIIFVLSILINHNGFQFLSDFMVCLESN